MRKLAAIICALATCVCLGILAACGDVAVESVTLDKTAITLTVGGEETLTATVTPDNATDKTVVWSSSDTSVATVNGGKVTAQAEGTATITAKAGEKSATCTVTVNKAEAETVAVESVTLDKTAITLTAGDEETLTATVTPDDATDKTVVWSSSDTSVATVNGGKVTAQAEGTATITAKAGEKSATCTVTVNKANVKLTEEEWVDVMLAKGIVNYTAEIKTSSNGELVVSYVRRVNFAENLYCDSEISNAGMTDGASEYYIKVSDDFTYVTWYAEYDTGWKSWDTDIAESGQESFRHLNNLIYDIVYHEYYGTGDSASVSGTLDELYSLFTYDETDGSYTATLADANAEYSLSFIIVNGVMSKCSYSVIVGGQEARAMEITLSNINSTSLTLPEEALSAVVG